MDNNLDRILRLLLEKNTLSHSERHCLDNQTVKASELKLVLNRILKSHNRFPMAETPDQLGENCQIEILQSGLYLVRKSSEYSYLKYKYLWEKEFKFETEALECYLKEQFKNISENGFKIDWNS